MKTAMQEAIEYLKSFNLESSAIILEDKFLEKEKEQMINFGYECRDFKSILPQDRFEATYNQNKLLKNYINSIKVDPIKSQVTTTGTGVWTPKTNNL
jgi:Ulp1 family protease